MRRGGAPDIRVWSVLRAVLALVLIALVARSTPGAADEIGLAVDTSEPPFASVSTTGITCLSTARISFFPADPQPERVVRIDVLSPFASGEVTLLSSLPLYFESEAQETDGHRWSWFTWS